MASRTGERITTVLYMTAAAVVFTATVAAVNAALREGIDAHERVKEIRGALDALGIAYDRNASAREIEERAARRIRRTRSGDLTFHEGLDEKGQPIGRAYPIGGAGFWGPIRGYVAIDPAGRRIIGISFTRHHETPGLGARITEDRFRQQFVGMSIVPEEGSSAAFRLVPLGRPKGMRDLDAITGATGTSKAVEMFLNRNLSDIRRRSGTE